MKEQEIFLEALNPESSEERQAFIKERYRSDVDLRKRIEALLQAHAETGNFLGSPSIGSFSELRSQTTEDAGTIVGPKKTAATNRRKRLWRCLHSRAGGARPAEGGSVARSLSLPKSEI